MYNKSWEQQQSEARGNMSRRKSALMSLGISSFNSRNFRFDPPCLINLSDDPSLRGTLIYHIPEGAQYSLGSGKDNDIVLSGLSIAPRNCHLRNDLGVLTIYLADRRHNEAPPRVEVNQQALHGSEPRMLQHHDRIVFGRSRAFYVVLKAEPRNSDSSSGSGSWPLISLPQPDRDQDSQTETHVAELLGDRVNDPEQMEMAQENIRVLKSHNLDDAGENAMRKFFFNARRAKGLVDEANEITNCLRPNEGLFFRACCNSSNFGHRVPSICPADV
jgi:hypothetical protein